MNQLAKSVKDVVNIFKPEPLKSDQLKFYQKTAAVRDCSQREFYDTLFEHITIADEPTRLLVVGHMGCGKSTELRMLMKELADYEIPCITVNATQDLDLQNFDYIDVLMRIIERTAEYAKNNELTVDKRIVNAFYDSLSTTNIKKYWVKDAKVGVEAPASVLSLITATVGITASLKMASGFSKELRLEIQPNIGSIVASLNAFINHLNEQTKKSIVIIIDGLEKGRYEYARKLFCEDISAISDIKAHLVMTCPLSIYRSPDAVAALNYFFVPTVIPMIKTHNKDGSAYQEGIDVIRELILKRADESLFDKDVLKTIIIKTGGYLRHTCKLLSNCAFEAYMRNKKVIDMESVNFTINKFTTDVFFMVKGKHYKRIEEIYKGDHIPRPDAESFELLYCGAILEYNNGDRWVNLHPLVRDYIDNHPDVLD
ncbi:MAG: ATP-binding protein [Chitinispirillales bacterium]|jgi:nucleoside-triphosphatase THEP1|nr:ATP-binding protein [Chitinispirillales bacterium]